MIDHLVGASIPVALFVLWYLVSPILRRTRIKIVFVERCVDDQELDIAIPGGFRELPLHRMRHAMHCDECSRRLRAGREIFEPRKEKR